MVDTAPSAREEWLDRQIANLRELVEGEEHARSETPPHSPEPSTRRRRRTRSGRSIFGCAARAVASAVVAACSFVARLLLLPFHLLSVVEGLLRPSAAGIAWGAAAVALGGAVGAGITFVLR